jgi:hypothetical protein
LLSAFPWRRVPYTAVLLPDHEELGTDAAWSKRAARWLSGRGLI